MAKRLEQVTGKNGYRHYELIDDVDRSCKRLPSVTTIIKVLDGGEILSKWKINETLKYVDVKLHESFGENKLVDLESERYRDILVEAKQGHKIKSKEAMATGTVVHEAIETYLKDGVIPYRFPNKDAENGFNAFLDWEKKNEFRSLVSEIKLYNEDFEFAGTADNICELSGIKTLIDFKTSKGFWDSYPLQLSAYMFSHNKLYPEDPIKAIGVLRLDKETGKPYYKDYTKNYKNYIKMFLALATYMKIKNETVEEK